MRRPSSRSAAALAVLSGAALFAASPALAGVDHVRAGGVLVRYAEEIPVGAGARVHVRYDSAGDTRTTIRVRGLRPDTSYQLRVHESGCGAIGRAAGPTFQNVASPDPESPTDPTYANPGNEIWLDISTDATGRAVARSTVSWQFSPERRAGSVIIHRQHIPNSPRELGVTGARLACLGVGF
jgi:superoxide dismutase, Cu-Zn family